MAQAPRLCLPKWIPPQVMTDKDEAERIPPWSVCEFVSALSALITQRRQCQVLSLSLSLHIGGTHVQPQLSLNEESLARRYLRSCLMRSVGIPDQILLPYCLRATNQESLEGIQGPSSFPRFCYSHSTCPPSAQGGRHYKCKRLHCEDVFIIGAHPLTNSKIVICCVTDW